MLQLAMPDRYDPSSAEPRWQEAWQEAGIHTVDLRGAEHPFYTLVMYPYPSGDRLHVGHWYNFGPADSYARFKRMQGYDVLEPMGFDAFGLPAENYAVKKGVHPRQSISGNVEHMTQQLKRTGAMYDWSKAINSSEPAYYRWTQWLFLKMYENGLAYRSEGNVNFCPDCQTVLANEQCQDGLCDRCGAEVTQKPMTQWYWKITDYADRLIDNLNDLDWPEKTKMMQRNWIGRKTGIDITYEVEGTDETLTCFTTRPDTNFGATFIVLAPEHPFAQQIAGGQIVSERQEEVRRYLEEARNKSERERQEEGRKKTGVFTGYEAVNNLNGRKLPIWISDFVLGGFGTGAVVGVPGHDKRDFEFAQAFDLPVVRVVVAPDGDTSEINDIEQVQEEEGTMINSEFLDGLDIYEAKEKIMQHFEKQGWGKRTTTYRLRDWSVGRQRYWGAPIPMVYDPEGNPHPVPEEHLPWELPGDVEEFRPAGTAPLAQSQELIERTERIFGEGWRPEVDTMDTFVDSSYYYLLYLSTENTGVHCQGSVADGALVDADVEQRWMPVDMYIGGAEHACMHLIYARFVMMALKDFGFVSREEPFKKLVHQGVITHEGAKMSKSKGNVVSPDAFVETYGSDVFRMYLMFMGPFTEGGDWSDSGIKGIDRFVQRIWRLFTGKLDTNFVQSESATAQLHRTIRKTGEDIERLHFNTAIAALMELLNALEEEEALAVDTARTYARLLAPLAPHLAEELWQLTEGDGFVIQQHWPAYDESYLQAESVTVAVQVNGKVRGRLEVASDAAQEEVIAQAKELENVARHLEGTDVKQEIYVPGKLVNLVV